MPDNLDHGSRTAIEQALTRLNTATGANDIALMIGSAKELAESVAKVVLAARGVVVASRANLPDVLNRAHAALDRQPGQGLAADAEIRNIAQGAKTMATQLPELRNKYGTGHGRAVVPEVADELALVAIDAALLWIRWSLRRLHHIIKGQPDLLVRDLDEGVTFYRGDLRDRLAAARLTEHDETNQHLVGFAVARRAMRGTYLARVEGVQECAESTDLERWPNGYRSGLLNGLFLTIDGLIDATPWSVQLAALLLQTSADHLFDTVTELAHTVAEANYSPRLGDDETRKETERAARSMHPQVPRSAHQDWQKITDRLEIPF